MQGIRRIIGLVVTASCMRAGFAQDMIKGVPFRPGIWIRQDPIMGIVPECSRFLLVGRGKEHPLTSMADFKGLMDVRRPEDALAVVRCRLFLSGPTGVNMPPGDFAMEILTPEAELADEKRLGYAVSTDMFKYWQQWNGEGGIVSSKVLRSAVAGFPSVHKKGSVFVVTRLFAVAVASAPREFQVKKITEEVGPDGSYRWVSAEPVRTGPLPSVKWRVFVRM